MSAPNSYQTSVLVSFSTFLDRSRAADGDKQAATELLKGFVAWKSQEQTLETWNQDEVDVFLEQTTNGQLTGSFAHHTQNQNATELLKQFIQRHPPYQISVFLQRYLLALKADGCSASTIRNYRSDINQFWQFSNKHQLNQALVKPVIATFVRHERQKGLQTSSIRRKLASLSQFGLWAQRQGLVAGVSWLHNPQLLEELEQNLSNTREAAFIVPEVKKPVISSVPAVSTPTQPPIPLPKKQPITAQRFQERRAQIKSQLDTLSSRVKNQTRALIAPYVTLALVVLFFLGVGVFGYQQLIQDTPSPLAFPSVPTPPNRILSFQGRLTDIAQNPITATTDFQFRLYDTGPGTGGTLLWDSGTCAVTPDQDGIFSVGLGANPCGTAITEDVFSENTNVWLEVQVEAETLTPRQPIRTVPYALNSETLQGYPINASGAATVNTVLTMNDLGQVVLGEIGPEIYSVSGQFAITGQSLLLQTENDGDIILDADGTGGIFLNNDTTVTGGLQLDGDLTTSLTTFNLLNTTATTINFGGAATTMSIGAGTGTTTINNDLVAAGTITSPTLNTPGGIIYAGSGGTLAVSAAGTSGDCLLSGGAGTPTFGSCAGAVSSSILWHQVLGTAQLKNTTLDLLVGGTSTASAKFAVLNVNTGTPVASVSSGVSGTAAYLTADGTLATASRMNLTIGNSSTYNTTGNVLINPNGTGNVGIGTTNPASRFHVNVGTNQNILFQSSGSESTITAVNDASSAHVGLRFIGNGYRFFSAGSSAEIVTFLNGGNIGIGSTAPAYPLDVTGYVRSRVSTNTATGFLIQNSTSPLYGLQTAVGGRFELFDFNNIASRFSVLANGNFGIGTTAPIGKFQVTGAPGAGGNALAIFNQTNADDILTASASGTTRLRLSNAGGLFLSALNTAGGVVYTDADGQLLTSAAGTTGDCLLSGGAGAPTFGSCAGAVADSILWHQVLGTAQLKNTTLDLIVGGTSTASAKFAVLNANGTGPVTATVSGNLIVMPTNGAGGNVGIGTINPNRKVTINSGVTNVNLGLTGSGIEFSRAIDGGYASSITNDAAPAASLTYLTYNDHIFQTLGGQGLRVVRDSVAAITKVLVGTGSVNNGASTLFNVNGSAAIGSSYMNTSAPSNGLIVQGNVGIGTTSPGASLDVRNSAAAGQAINAQTSGTSGTSYAVLGQALGTSTGTNIGLYARAGNASTNQALYIESLSASANNYAIYSAAAAKSYFAGNVGIGTTDPTLASLQIQRNNSSISGAGHLSLDVGSGALSRISVLNFRGTLGSGADTNAYNSGFITSGYTGSGFDTSYLNFIVNNSGGSSVNAMRITNGGNVGIGTTSPTERLSIRQASGTPAVSLLSVRNENLAVGDTNSILFRHSTGDTNYFAAVQSHLPGSNAVDLQFVTQSTLATRAVNMVIKGSGNVGIGTTAPATRLDIIGNNAQQLRISNTTADATLKNLYIQGRHFTNSEEDISALLLNGNSTSNSLHIGGGSSSLNAVTDIRFYTAANNTTTTGTEAMRIISSGFVGIGSTTPGATLDIVGTLRASGAVTFSNYTTDGGIFYANGSGLLAQTTAGGAGECLVSNGGGAPTWSSCAAAGGQLWRLASGAISPINDTVDLLIGSSATASAKFGFLNVAGGTPVASISANSGAIATYLTGDGTLATTNRNNLTIGNSSAYNTTGNVLINPNGTGNVGIGTTAPNGPLEIQGASGTNTLIIRSTGGLISENSGIQFQNSSGANARAGIGWDATFGGLKLSTSDSGKPIVFSNSMTAGAGELMRITGAGDVGIGTTTPIGKFVVSGAPGAGGNALAIFNQTNADDILTASASGTTRLRLSNAGGLFLSALNTAGGVVYTDADGQLLTSAAGTTGDCLLSGGAGAPTFGSCAGAVADSILWHEVLGTAQLKNTTLDMLVGGTSTASAKFAVLNVNGTGPATASVSGNLIVMPHNGAGGRVGIGTIAPTSRIDITTNNLGVTQTADSGLALVNNTAAAAGAQQISPAVRWTGQGWKTNATAASQPVEFQSYVLPVQGTVNPTGQWLLQSSVNSSAFSSILTVNSNAGSTEFMSTGIRAQGAGGNTGGLSLNGSAPAANTIHVNPGFLLSNSSTPSPTGANVITFATTQSQATSGTTNITQVAGTFAPTSGTGLMAGMRIAPTINQTGGANGITRGIFIEPTLTAAADFRALEMSNNSGYGIYQSGASALNYFAGNVGIGSTTPGAKLDIVGTLRASGAVTFSNYTTDGGIFYANGSGLLAQTTAGSANECLISNGGGAPTWGNCATAAESLIHWTVANGALFPKNSTLDFFIGGQATDSAKFAVLNVNGTGPATASVSGNLIVMPHNGAGGRVGIGTTNPTAMLDVRGNVNLQPAAGTFTSITTPASTGLHIDPGYSSKIEMMNYILLYADGSTGVSPGNDNTIPLGTASRRWKSLAVGTGGAFFQGDVGIGTNSPTSALEIGTGVLTLPSGSAGAPSITFSGNTNTGIYRVGTNTVGVAAGGNAAATFASNGSVTLGTWVGGGGSVVVKPTSGGAGNADRQGLNLTLASGESTGNGLGSNLIFQTSPTGVSSGTSVNALVERMRIAQDGNVGIGSTSPGALLDVAGTLRASGAVTFSNYTTDGGIFYANGSGLLAQTTAGGAGECLVSNGGGAPTWSSCAAAGGQLWRLASGAISPINDTVDLLIGSSATASAKFAVLNVNGTGPATASVSGNLIVMPHNGAGGRVGIGTNSPTSALHVRGLTEGTSTVESVASLLLETSGDMANGFGPRLNFNIRDNSSSEITSAYINTRRIGGSDSTGALDVYTNISGTLTQQLSIDRNQLLFNTTGNAAAPSYSFLNDADTGMFRAGANLLAFSTSGTEAMRIIANGNVGIGTTAPAYKLDLATTTSDTGTEQVVQRIKAQSTGTMGNGFGPALLFQFQDDDGTERDAFKISSTRSNGADTYSSTSFYGRVSGSLIEYLRLQSGTLRIAPDGTAADPVLSWANDTDTGIFHSANTLGFSTSGVEALRIASTGNVGIGTTNPLTTVQVGAGNVLPAHAGGSYGSGTQDLSINKLSGESSLGVMVSDGTNNRRVKLFLDQTNGVAGIRQEAASGSVPFVYNLGGSELLRIATTGNVGIGTTTPISKLDLADAYTGAGTYSNAQFVTSRANSTGSTINNQTSGFYNYFTVSGANSLGNVGGVRSRLDVTNTGGDNVTSSLVGDIRTSGSGIADELRAIYASITSGGGTVEAAYGLKVNDLANTSTITNTYGVYVGDITTGTQTNTPFSFYASDASAYNYFAGNVGIGTTAPTQGLLVLNNGTSAVGAYIGTNATRTVPNLRLVGQSANTTDGGGGLEIGDGSGTFLRMARQSDNTFYLRTTNTFKISTSPSANLTADTAFQSFNPSASVGSSGTFTDQKFVVFNQPTLTGTATITNAANVYIANAPSVSGPTISNTYALWVDDGVSRFDGLVGIGSITPGATLDIVGTLRASGAVTFSNYTTDGGIFYANGSGLLAQTTAGGAGECLVSNGGGAPTWSSCAAAGGNLWRLASGAISPINDTVDLLIGSSATASAKFAVLNVNTGTPVASVSSGTSGTAAFLTADGTLSTANRMNLTLGNSSTYNTTGNILLNPNGTGRVGINLTTPTHPLHVAGSARVGNVVLSESTTTSVLQVSHNGGSSGIIRVANNDGDLLLAGDNLSTGGRIAIYGRNQAGGTGIELIGGFAGSDIAVRNLTITGSGAAPTATVNQHGADVVINGGPSATGGGTDGDVILASLRGNVGIGTTAPTALLSVGATSQFQVDASGNITTSGDAAINGGDLTTTATTFNLLNTNATTINFGGAGTTIGIGSTAGTTTINNNLTVAGSTITFSTFTTDGGLLYTNGSGVLAQTAAGTAGQCLGGGATPTWVTCTSIGSHWRINAGAISPINDTLDLLIGSNATESAKFAFINVDDGTPTASISANANDVATFLTGDGFLSTTSRQALTIGNSSTYNTTGNTLINPNGVGSVGIGTTAPIYPLDLLSSTTDIGGRFRLTTTSGINIALSASSTGVGAVGNQGASFLASGATTNYGLTGSATGGTGSNIGARFTANNGTTNRAIEILADAGASNYAIYSQATAQSYFAGNIGIGTTTINAPLHVEGAYSSNAAAIINQLNSGDILTASASGTTRLRLTNGGQLLAGSGTNTAPTFSFLTDDNTGMYNSAGDEISLSIGGTQSFVFNSSAFRGVLGSAGTPGISFTGDTNTGIFGSGSDVLGFSTGGTERLRISDIGRIGIGTTTLTGGVNISLNSGNNAGLIVNELGGGDLIAASASGSLRFRVDTAGYVHAQRFVDTADANYFLDPAATGDALVLAGDIRLTKSNVNIFGAGGGGPTTINIDADPDGTGCAVGGGATCVVMISGGIGKLDAGAIDPPYWIEGVGYATYAPSMIGIYEEITRVVTLEPSSVPGVYKYVIDFPNLNQNNDLDMWLFTRITDFGPQMKNLAVLVSSHSDSRVGYKKDLANQQLIIYSDKPSEVSFRLTSPRFDGHTYSTIRPNQDGRGFRPAAQVFNVTSGGTSDQDLAAAVGQSQTWTLSGIGTLNVNGSEPGQISVTQSNGTQISKADAMLGAVIGQLRSGFIETRRLVAERINAAEGEFGRLRANQRVQTPRVETDLISPFAGNDLTLQANNVRVRNQQNQTVAQIDAAGNAEFKGNVKSKGLLADLVNTQQLNAGTVSAQRVNTTTISAQNAAIAQADITSARIQALEAHMADLETIRAQTADIVTATISGTLYADDIYAFEDKISSALQAPSLLAQILGQVPQSSSSASLDVLYQVVDIDPITASGAGSLKRSLADLGLGSEDITLGASAAFINQYFQVNGSAYIADSLGVQNTLLLGSGTRLSEGELEYIFASDPASSVLKLQPSGVGSIELLAGVMTITQDGSVSINGDLNVAGSVKADTLLSNLLAPADFGNPFQVQVAGASTESGQVQESRFEIINELGTPVATISAQGRADFAAGIGVGTQDLGDSQDASANQPSGRATVTAGNNQVVINSNLITEKSLVYVTPVGSTGNQVLYVKSQTTHSGETQGQFVVGFDSATENNVQFNWWIVN